MQTTIDASAIKDTAIRLYRHLLESHWKAPTLTGPDYGIRFNARIWRFLKSYLSFLPWQDDLVYMQAQEYWISDNWLMADLQLADAEMCRQIAIACTDYVLAAQQPEGYWEYPNPEWRDRIATVEGNYASMGLLETYLRTGHEPYLDAAKKWYEYVLNHVGFLGEDGRLAVNYFANIRGGKVPNNSASALRTFGLLYQATGDEAVLEPCRGMVLWLSEVQLETGELPYALHDPTASDRIHFLCFQYNAFQFLNILDYYHIVGDEDILPILRKLAAFLAGGLTDAGAARYDCHHPTPEVSYYTAAVAAALSQAASHGMGDYQALADKAYRRVLSQQKPESGATFFSRKNYGFLMDKRSYPRSQSMMLYHLLLETKARSDSL